MVRPTVSDTTERVYARLPELYRTADETNGDYPLLRYLSTIVDQAGEAEAVLDRWDYVTPDDGGDPDDTSDLADPATADEGWLAWLAQHVGVRFGRAWTVEQKRAAIAASSNGYRAGSKGAMEAGIRPLLTGSQTVRVIDHDGGDEWLLRVETYLAETPDQPAVEAVAEAHRPAGTELTYDVVPGPTYALVLPTTTPANVDPLLTIAGVALLAPGDL